MRRRLFVVFLVPLAAVLVLLGGAYGWAASRSVQQAFYTQQIGDLGSFVTSARQALHSGSAEVLDGELRRYQELYGTRVVVVDRTGRPWAPAAGASAPAALVLDEPTAGKVQLALSGRRGDLPEPVVLPWQFAEQSLVEPIVDDGDVIGAVVMSASVDAPRSEIVRQWIALGIVTVLAIALGLLVVFRLAAWVLKPVDRVDQAMEAIERGEMEARIADDTGPPELRRMIGLFNRMAEEIERVVSRQQEFALNASHELRNPLNALLLRFESLATGLDRTWDEDVEATREEGRRMTRILDTLLSFARGEGGGPLLEPIDLGALAERRVAAWRDAAAAKGVSLALHLDGPVEAATDETIAESALDAVIDNAVKYSPAGSRIDVTAARTDEGCTLSVRDHGPGLAGEELAHATDRHWRSARTDSAPGSGLGLSIATDLLATVGGRVRVEAAEGGGLQVLLLLREAEAR
ncbi:HAMP domain-containing sensor histidine kinase [Microbacterium capsulatum]|uniref:histidine kinase n=1 Tax=Microbacterium capsulatum TaxID=3041921 RepID=A0ABU0XG89_9MICO|nr:HAMP domain-containing sensor histidine kinase [Microbacterium sp. ASV81]MDQ4214141.1 HAMP domain-containing sensor histidine kinase [Microbacterium sp. ASV81]